MVWTAGRGHIDVVRVLLEQGVNLRPYPGRCDTAMGVARRWQQKEVVLFLMSYFPNTAVNSNKNSRKIVEGRLRGSRGRESRP